MKLRTIYRGGAHELLCDGLWHYTRDDDDPRQQLRERGSCTCLAPGEPMTTAPHMLRLLAKAGFTA
jgi:hypothetical protein